MKLSALGFLSWRDTNARSLPLVLSRAARSESSLKEKDAQRALLEAPSL